MQKQSGWSITHSFYTFSVCNFQLSAGTGGIAGPVDLHRVVLDLAGVIPLSLGVRSSRPRPPRPRCYEISRSAQRREKKHAQKLTEVLTSSTLMVVFSRGRYHIDIGLSLNVQRSLIGHISSWEPCLTPCWSARYQTNEWHTASSIGLCLYRQIPASLQTMAEGASRGGDQIGRPRFRWIVQTTWREGRQGEQSRRVWRPRPSPAKVMPVLPFTIFSHTHKILLLPARLLQRYSQRQQSPCSALTPWLCSFWADLHSWSLRSRIWRRTRL